MYFYPNGHDAFYPAYFKRSVVEAYWKGEGSFQKPAVKYNIPFEITIR